MEKTYEVIGMTCVICKRNVEKALLDVKGVNSAKVNLIENEVLINYDETLTNENILEQKVKEAGYKLIINKENKINYAKTKLIISIILIIFEMLLSMNIINLNSIIQLFVATTIILLNIDIYKSGTKALIHLNPNMNSLVTISSFVSYIYSIYSLIKIINGNNNYHLYFETSAMILVIVKIGKTIEGNTKQKTVKTIKGLTSLIPMNSNLLKDNNILVVPTTDIKKGDIVLVNPGESIPQDGIVVKGTSLVNESMITGESLPIDKKINDNVIGGTINLSGQLQIQITKQTSTSTISSIINLTKKATMEKLPIERIVDRISKYFVFVVLIISLITFIIWYISSKNIELALNFSLSVLVISCPCALGLATPAAIAVANSKAASNGIIIKKPEIFETISKTKNIILDKTGTLTENRLAIVEIKEFDSDFINILSSIEKTSNHPIAKSIVEKYNPGNIIFETSEVIEGQGIIAKKDNDIYKAGNSLLINNIDKEYIDYAHNLNYSYVAISKNDKVLGIVYLSDYIRENSKQAIQELHKRNINPIMCTGDKIETAKKVADYLSIKEYIAEVKPEDKSNLVNEKKKEGIVIMVGDGINDAVALTNADISLSLSNASDIASYTSDVILMKNNLNDIPFLYDLGRKTIRIIKQNLTWALFYNSVCIPLAAGLLYTNFNLKLNPMIGSISMWISSMFVLLNALRIRRTKND